VVDVDASLGWLSVPFKMRLELVMEIILVIVIVIVIVNYPTLTLPEHISDILCGRFMHYKRKRRNYEKSQFCPLLLHQIIGVINY